MENFIIIKFHNDWMENVAVIPKILFSVGRGCRVFHVAGIKPFALLGQIIFF